MFCDRPEAIILARARELECLSVYLYCIWTSSQEGTHAAYTNRHQDRETKDRDNN
jgi:hypothetical protein